MSAALVVIGGGPAGLAAAIAAAQAGFSVEVAEPALRATHRGPVDKCCGEGLLPPATAALQRLGLPVELLREHAHPIRGIQFHTPGQTARASFGHGAMGLGMRRTMLHSLLLQHALRHGVRVTAASARLVPGGAEMRVSIGDREHAPQWILGADGSQSRSRDAAGLARGRTSSQRYALRQHFLLARHQALPAQVEVFWADGAQAYVTPVGGGRVGVAVLSVRRQQTMAQELERFPALARRLQGADACTSARGAVSFHRTFKRVQRGSFALVGDASGSVDAVTGDGLSLAFQQSLEAVDAMRAGDLSLYQLAHDRLMWPARLMSRALLTMSAHPIGTGACMVLLSHVPKLFGALLRVHTQHALPTGSTPEEKSPWQAAAT